MANEWRVDRRGFLRGAGAVGVASGGGALLAACSGEQGRPDSGATGNATGDGTPSGAARTVTATGSAGSTGSSSEAGAVSLVPRYAPADSVKPDLPALDNGTPAAFFKYPANPVRVHADPPLTGGQVSALKMVSTAVPPPVDKNPFWQEMNKRLGAELKLNNIIASDYRAKLATALAGGDLPDLVQLSMGYAPHMDQVLAHEFQDLSDFIGGDAVLDYPWLAALPTISWKNVILNGGIWGVPFPLATVGSDVKVRQDIIGKLGLSVELSNGEDFLALCKNLTDSKNRRWALDTIPNALRLAMQMVGVPNEYKVVDGVFTNAIETEEYKRSLDICHRLWDAGNIYPDSVSSTSNVHQWFVSGQVVISTDGYTNWATLTSQGVEADPTFKMGGLLLPKWDGGGQAAHYTGNGMYTFCAIKKTNASRVKDLLRAMEWMAGPFGTEEYLFKTRGIPGRDYKLQDTDPIETSVGITECQQLNVSYIANASPVLYIAGDSDLTKTDYTYLAELMKVTEPLPTVGLVSETALTKAASLTKPVNDMMTDIIVGRKKLSEWDGVVKTYLSSGGSQINQEYSEAYAKANGG